MKEATQEECMVYVSTKHSTRDVNQWWQESEQRLLEGAGEGRRYWLSAVSSLLGWWKCSRSWSGWWLLMYKFGLKVTTQWDPPQMTFLSEDLTPELLSCWPRIYSRQEVLSAYLPEPSLLSCKPPAVPAETELHSVLPPGSGLTVGQLPLILTQVPSLPWRQTMQLEVGRSVSAFSLIVYGGNFKIVQKLSVCPHCFLL